MADTVSFIQTGTITLELNSGDFDVKKIDLSTPAPETLWHVPDQGDNQVVRIEDGDRKAVLMMNVGGSDWDDVQNNLGLIRHWLREAKRAEVDKDTIPVRLRVKRSTTGSTATTATNHQIRFGWLEGDSSIFTPVAQKKEQALVVFLHLVLTPYGESNAPITLRNYMLSSPHFVEDTAADGLADGWNDVGTPTTAIVDSSSGAAARYLIGGQTQQVTTDHNSTEGIRSSTVTAAAASDAVAYIWINATGGSVNDLIDIFLADGAGNSLGGAAQKQFDPDTPANYDKTTTDENGYTWYRYTMTGNNGGIANFRLYIQRTEPNSTQITTFYVDGTYMRLTETTSPDAWMSARNLDNRLDIQSTSTATENQLNYIDIWGVPGDAEPLVDMTLASSTVGTQYAVISQVYDGEHKAAEKAGSYEAEDAATKDITDGGFTDPADAARSHGEYQRFTATDNAATGTFYWQMSAAASPAFTSSKLRVIAICRSDDTSATIKMATLHPAGAESAVARSVQTSAVWEALDLGSIDATQAYDADTAYVQGFQIDFVIANVADTKYFDCDVIFFMPVDHGFMYIPAGTPGNQPVIYIYGTKKRVTSTENAGVQAHGGIWACAPGNMTSRRHVLVFETDGTHDLTDDMNIALSITPRTRHLVGTI